MSYNDLDLNLIKTFLTVYECKSIILASKKLYISQPAVTSSIKKLESYLGGKLFIRTPKGVVPTIEGEEFNTACYNAGKILDSGINKFKSLSNLEEGRLNIGSSSTIIRRLLLPFIESFTKKHPKVVISVTDATSDKLVKYTKNGTVDLAILNMPISLPENFDIIPIYETHDCFIAHKDFEKDYLTLDELKKQKLIVQKRPSSNRDYFEEMCGKNNIQFRPSYEIGSFGLITDFVENKMGIAYTIKEFINEDLKNRNIKVLETEFKSDPRNVSVITSQVSTNSFACEKFIEEIKEYFKK